MGNFIGKSLKQIIQTDDITELRKIKNLNKVKIDDYNILHYACILNKTQTVIFLLSQNVDVNSICKNYYPLDHALNNNNLYLIEILLSYGALCNNNPIELQEIDLFIKFEQINKQYRNILIRTMKNAIIQNDYDTLIYLINNGINICEIKDYYFFQSIISSNKNYNINIIKLLINIINLDNNTNYNKILEILCLNNCHETLKQILDVRKIKKKPIFTCINKYSLLKKIYFLNHIEIIKLLIEYDNENNITQSLIVYAYKNSPQIFNYLIQHPKSVISLKNNMILLNHIIKDSKSNDETIILIKKLLFIGLDLNIATKTKNPLYCACNNRKIDIFNFLLENGADPNIYKAYGKSLIQYAYQENMTRFIYSLIVYGANINDIYNIDEDNLYTTKSKIKIVDYDEIANMCRDILYKKYIKEIKPKLYSIIDYSYITSIDLIMLIFEYFETKDLYLILNKN